MEMAKCPQSDIMSRSIHSIAWAAAATSATSSPSSSLASSRSKRSRVTCSVAVAPETGSGRHRELKAVLLSRSSKSCQT